MLIRLWLLYRRFHHIQDVFLSSLLLFLKLHHRANGAVAIVMALMVAVHIERTIGIGVEAPHVGVVILGRRPNVLIGIRGTKSYFFTSGSGDTSINSV